MSKRGIIIIICIILVMIGGFYIAGQVRTYSDYTVLKSTDRSYSSVATYETFNDNLIVYGSDGITCTDIEDNLLWSQSYELEQPVFAQCEDYAVIAEKDGKEIYVFDTNGYVTQYDTTARILQVDVAADGSVAVVTISGEDYNILLYDIEGELQAKGEVHLDNTGYPAAIALSPNARLLAVSYVCIGEGSVNATLNFYNFGSVGDNEIDNIVSSYSYDNLVIAQLAFLNDKQLVAFGNGEIQIYSGAQKPALSKQITLDNQINSIFYGEEIFGVVYQNDTTAVAISGDSEDLSTYTMVVYNENGKRKYEHDFDLSYSDIRVLSNGEVCILGEFACEIVSRHGKTKFQYTFDETLYGIIAQGNLQNYVFVLSDHTDQIRLK